MRHLKSCALGAAALCALAFTLTAPAVAQISDNGPQYSTPAEQEQTRALNQQALGGTTTAPETLNGTQTAQDTSQDASEPDEAAPSPAQSEQDRYQDRVEQYRDQRRQYEQSRAEYEHDLHKYDRQEFAYEDYPTHAYAYRYENGGRYSRALYLLPRPSEQLFEKPIESPSGEWVGKVRSVDTAPDGRPTQVEVALNRRVSVWVSPDHFRYDPVDGVVMTDLTRDELWDQTAAVVEAHP